MHSMWSSQAAVELVGELLPRIPWSFMGGMSFAKSYLEIMKVVRVLVGLRLLGKHTQDQEEAYTYTDRERERGRDRGLFVLYRGGRTFL